MASSEDEERKEHQKRKERKKLKKPKFSSKARIAEPNDNPRYRTPPATPSDGVVWRRGFNPKPVDDADLTKTMWVSVYYGVHLFGRDFFGASTVEEVAAAGWTFLGNLGLQDEVPTAVDPRNFTFSDGYPVPPGTTMAQAEQRACNRLLVKFFIAA